MISHQWVKYNVTFPAYHTTRGNALFPIADTQYRYMDLGSHIFTGDNAHAFQAVTTGLRFIGGNVKNINIWLDGVDADLYPRVGSGNTSCPLFKERIFDLSDNTTHFQLKYLILNENSSSDYNMFINEYNAIDAGGSIMPITEDTSINLGMIRNFRWSGDIHRDYLYSSPVVFRMFAPTNTSPYPYINWDIRNFRIHVKYESVE